MSVNPRQTARAYDVAPARLLSLIRHQAGTAPAAESYVADDLADGIEALHQIANLAGYSERPRAFILALATAAHARGGESVELFDKELADLQNCSTKTVQRQRADYIREARRLRNVELVGIEEGEYDREKKQHAPTQYTFHLAATVERVVGDARSDTRWHDLGREAQRERLKQAAARAYPLIPGARRKPRNRKRPRPATAVVETHCKAAETHLRKLRETVAVLPNAERERLLDAQGYLREWWHKVRAEMDEFYGADSAQTLTPNHLEGGGGQNVHHLPARTSADATEPDPADVAVWERSFAGLSDAAAVRAVEIPLRPPEYLSGDPSFEKDEDEVREAEAIRAEGRGEL